VRKALFNKAYAEYLKSPQWQMKRKKVMERDNGLCQGCLTAPAVDVHHKTYQRVFDEPLFDLVAICRECHSKIHDGRADFQRADGYARPIAKPEQNWDDLEELMKKLKASK